MLTLTRKEGESLYIMLADGKDPRTLVGEVLGKEPIIVRIGLMNPGSVKISVGAPVDVNVLREELLGYGNYSVDAPQDG